MVIPIVNKMDNECNKSILHIIIVAQLMYLYSKSDFIKWSLWNGPNQSNYTENINGTHSQWINLLVLF